MLRFLALPTFLVTFLVSPIHADDQETLLLQNPTVSAEHVVFVYAQDLWVVSRSGGDARRLTSHPGAEGAPQLSPDGKLVAFTGEYEGNSDVYVIPVEGGIPQRLTWHPGGDAVVDWHPDGERILFRSSRTSSAPVQKLFLVRLDGRGLPEELPVPKANHASFDGDASHLAYTPFRDAFRSWKRYRGGTTPPIWILDLKTYDTEEIPHVNASDTFPCWLDGQVYFASDRDDRMNLYRYAPGGGAVEKLTDFDSFDVRNMDTGGGALVLEQAGAIHLFDPKVGVLTRLEIRVRADGLYAMPRWQTVAGAVRNAAVAPNGKRAVFEARGEIVTVPKENGDARNLTNSPAAHDRDPAWSPDGEKIAWFSDADGEYRLLVSDRKGRGAPKVYDLGEGGFFYDPQFSPDGAHVLFIDKKNRIGVVELESGKVTDVATVQGSLGEVRPSATWSPDSKWIAFENRNPRTMYDHIALYEVATGKTSSVTDAFGAAGDPAFSGNGKHLFFTASVDVGPNLFGLDMSTSASRPPESNLYVAVLSAKDENPLAPKSDEGASDDDDDDDEKEGKNGKDGDGESPDEKEADEGKDGKKEDGAKKRGRGAKKSVTVTIDLDGIDQRVLALPLPSGQYGGLAANEKTLFFLESADGGRRLRSFDFDDRKAKTVADGVSGYELSANGKWILTNSRGAWAIQRAGAGGGGGGGAAMAGGSDDVRGRSRGGSGRLDIDGVMVRVEPQQEFEQILREVWRIQRDYFYDENMHGVDWPAMWRRWQPFLEHVRHRNDLNVLVYELIGELACGHQYGGGGDMPDTPRGVRAGLLGADWTIDKSRYRIARIYRGQNWSPRLRAPLTEPGVDAREGDYLITVDGRPVMADDNLFRAFENSAGRQVEITLASAPDGLDARTMTVVPLSSESQLRRNTWIEENRRRVDELSDGRLAYIYMPNTGGPGMAAFDRDFYSQLDRQGVVLDERYNGGGQVANYVIDVLSRQRMSYWMNREKWLAQSPFGMIEGPKVMIINESAGSGGDWMPWTFQNRGVGPLVGTRTWGGLVGISGYPPLMDGGFITAASFGVMDVNGDWAVENVGVSPDYKVVEWPKEVIAGRDPQLEKAVELALRALDENPVRPRPEYKPPVKR